ncbi:MAG: GAF domain-containing protein [Chloroflexi bacterium]|nr:GAF domain-containing protein [Chloroflexota bacterium]
MLTLLRPLIGAEALSLILRQRDMLEVVAMDQENVPDMRGIRLPLDSGIVGDVWQSGQSLFLQGEACLQQLSAELTTLTDYYPSAIMAVPIRWQEKAIGILEASHRQADAFDDEALRLLETAAAWTAIAIGNARQYQQLQRRLRESDAILTISNALTETFDLDELIQFIANRVQDIIDAAEWTAIHLVQSKTGQLELAASARLEIDPSAYLINPGEGIAGRVMAEGGVINVADVQADSRRLPIDLMLKARSLLIAPIESQQRRLGVISVQCAKPNAFTPGDERLLQILGVQAGLAIENARLYRVQQVARKRAEKQRERMRHMARRVGTSTRKGTRPYCA